MNWNPNGFVWLIDRTTLGGDEIVCDGQRIVLKPGEMRLYVPVDLVVWLYRTDKKRVWTTDGDFVHRYAVEAPVPDSLIAACGPEVADCSPIDVDRTRLEGSAVGVSRDKLKVSNVIIPADELRERLGTTGARVAFAEKG